MSFFSFFLSFLFLFFFLLVGNLFISNDHYDQFLCIHGIFFSLFRVSFFMESEYYKVEAPAKGFSYGRMM